MDHNQESSSYETYRSEMEELLRQIESGELELKERVDPRLVPLLRCLRELYLEKQEIFKKIFPEEFGRDVFNKIGELLHHHHHHQNQDHEGRDQVMMMSRSLSLDSPRSPAGKGEAEQPMRLERFKVKTFDVNGGAAAKQGTAANSK